MKISRLSRTLATQPHMHLMCHVIFKRCYCLLTCAGFLSKAIASCQTQSEYTVTSGRPLVTFCLSNGPILRRLGQQLEHLSHTNKALHRATALQPSQTP